MKFDLTEHFSSDEFRCKCCGDLVLDERLPKALEKLRMLAGRPIKINCGYRCPSHNAEIGGEPNSQHMEGRAADIVIQGMTPKQAYELAIQVDEFENGGIGLYPTFLHVDVRGTKARWGCKGGKMVGIAEALKG